MPKKCGVPVVVVIAAIWVMVVGVPSAAAAITSSNVTAPASGTFFQQNTDTLSDPAHQITVTGTTTNDGTPGNVNLICTSPNSGGTVASSTIATNVAVSSSDGSFSFSGAPPFDAERPCVIRAVPVGGGVPADLTPFTGPTVAIGDFDTTTVVTGPNAGLRYDFFDNDAQFSGDADYVSVGNGGLYDAWPVDPSTLVRGADLFFSDDYLSDANSDRSDIEVDGIPAYSAYAAENLLGHKGASFTGLPAVTFTQSQDPTTGDLTVHESEMLVQCEPMPATYPATASSCTSFGSTGIRFDRTIVQNQDGRQAQITDTYTSVDGDQHTIDLRYGQDFVNSDAGFNFPWVDGSTYNTHAAGDTESAPPSAPVSMFVNADNTIADGSENSAQGAITFADAPSALKFVPNGRFGHTHLDISYTRTVPAGRSASLKTTYSWAFTIADAHTLAALAEQEDMAPSVITGAASAITTTGATVAGSINPNGAATRYHFEYGTSVKYDQSTATASAGAGTAASGVTAPLTGLQPGTTYHYRLVATSVNGTTNGLDATFTTASPPAAITGAASAITTTGATVAGSINPNGAATSYHFEYGTSVKYDQSTATASAGAGTTASGVTAPLTGLQPGTTYHYRLVATSVNGTTNGLDATVKTASVPPPPPPPPPPPAPTKLTVGKVKIKGSTASIPLSCTGAAAAVCKGTLIETIRVKRHHHKRVSEKVAGGKFSIKAGAKKTVKLTLNKKGRKALGGFGAHKLRVTLTVRLAGKKVTARTLTFRHSRKEVVRIVTDRGRRSSRVDGRTP